MTDKITYEDAIRKLKEYEEKERLNFVELIKKFGDKYSDKELESKKLEELKVIADACSRFTPSMDRPDVIPMGGRMKEDTIPEGKVIDFSRVFEDVNKQFNMGKFESDDK